MATLRYSAIFRFRSTFPTLPLEVKWPSGGKSDFSVLGSPFYSPPPPTRIKRTNLLKINFLLLVEKLCISEGFFLRKKIIERFLVYNMMLRLVYVSEPCCDGERLAMASVKILCFSPSPSPPKPPTIFQFLELILQ